MRVLHAPENIAGQATIISESLQNLGVESEVLFFDKHPFSYKGEKSLDLKKRIWVGEKIVILLHNFLRCAMNYDIYHFHFGKSLLPMNIDLPILKLLRKKIIMHYWGSDIRLNKIAINYTLLSEEDLTDIYPKSSDKYKERKIKMLGRYVDASIVGDYHLLPYSPQSIVIKQAINLSKWEYVGPTNTHNKVKIVHAPSNRRVKGTNYILSTINKLNEEGENINFVLLENMGNEEVKKNCEEADIVIDQLLLESYGMFSIECMALGKPVLCRIDDKIIKYYPDVPIVRTDPENLYYDLKNLITNAHLREDLGKRGRIFVETVHDSQKISKQILDVYRDIY